MKELNMLHLFISSRSQDCRICSNCEEPCCDEHKIVEMLCVKYSK